MQTILNKPHVTTTPQRPKNLEDICGSFMGYLIHPSGKVISKNRQKILKPTYRNNIPYISLFENGVTTTFRLDQVVYRSFNCTYVIDSKEIIHSDGNQSNCRIKNLGTHR